jgi:hypothetical protein
MLLPTRMHGVSLATVACALSAVGCSVAFTHAPSSSLPTEISCTDSVAAPTVDAVLAIGAGIVAGDVASTAISSHCAATRCNDFGFLRIIGLVTEYAMATVAAGTAVGFAASAVHGYRVVSACKAARQRLLGGPPGHALE